MATVSFVDDEFKKAFNNDYVKAASLFLKGTSEYIKKELTKQANKEITRFYNDYSPKVYERTHNLMNNSYYGYINKIKNFTYEAGTKIDPSHMDPYYSRIYSFLTHEPHELVGAKEAVTYQSWIYGQHGGGSHIAYVTQPTPYKGLYDYAHSRSFLNMACNAGFKAMENGKYILPYNFKRSGFNLF